MRLHVPGFLRAASRRLRLHRVQHAAERTPAMRSLRHDFAARDVQGRVLLVLDNDRRGQFLDAGIESVRRVVPVPAADCRWIGR